MTPGRLLASEYPTTPQGTANYLLQQDSTALGRNAPHVPEITNREAADPTTSSTICRQQRNRAQFEELKLKRCVCDREKCLVVIVVQEETPLHSGTCH